MKLRPYQESALTAIFRFFEEHRDPDENCVVAMPTGTGKSPVIAEFCRRVLTWWPGQRILMLVHVKELVEQNGKTLKRIWAQAPLGIFSAGLGQKVAHMPITFAGVKSVARNLPMFGRQDIVVVDEAHLISDKESTDYQKVFAYLRVLNPGLRVVGLSATPFRLGMGMITEGSIFSHIAYNLCSLEAFNNLVDEGYLAPLVPMRTATKISLSGVGKVAGDYNQGQLAEAVNRKEITQAALGELTRLAANRRHWLIFCVDVQHVKDVHEMLTAEFGISANVVHGGMTNAQRDEALRAFKAGEVRACVNANILTTGYDHPALDCIALLRPTTSPGLHVQILGRGTRPDYAPGYDLGTAEGRLEAIEHSHKPNCLVLDFAGNVSRLGPINDPRIPKKGVKGAGEIPVKVCDGCGCLNHISARVCANCGEDFPIQEKITTTASSAEIIARAEEARVEEFQVTSVNYTTHQSLGKPDMLKVSYYCGIQRFSELVLLEHHHSQIIHKAHKWWKDRSDHTVPHTVAGARALEHTLRTPQAIRVWVNKRRNGKLSPEVMSAVFAKP